MMVRVTLQGCWLNITPSSQGASASVSGERKIYVDCCAAATVLYSDPDSSFFLILFKKA
jgi:hypothetical protein